MKRWLPDTKFVSELRKPRCDAADKTWADAQPPQGLYLSSVTIAEIRFGIDRVNDPVFHAVLLAWLTDTLRPWFAERILDVDEQVLLTWRQMVERGRTANHTYSQSDLLIAVSAAVHGLSVVTRNVDDFVRAKVPVLNPWTGRWIKPGEKPAASDAPGSNDTS